MKFALITADNSHKVSFKMNPYTQDVTSFMQWIYIFNGTHLSFEALKTEDISYLKFFDVVMMSGHPSYIEDIIKIANFLKDSNTITMFYPEGATQIYDNSINGFQPLHFKAMRACDILSYVEEDKASYYQAIVDRNETICRFIHVPITPDMSSSSFYLPREKKEMNVVIYGDNNPNHPMIAMMVVDQLLSYFPKMKVIGVETRNAPFNEIFPGLEITHISKLGQYNFLKVLAPTIINIYPTEWIGTARHQISCASVGTPCIGNKDSHTQMRLFPRLATGIYDIDKMKALAYDLIHDESFYNEVVGHALNELRFYDYGTTVRRFIDAVDSARQRFKSEKVAVSA